MSPRSVSVTPLPREALAGVELAHIFDTGWAIGKICSKIKRHLACLVPRQWLHKLDIEMYGEDKFWVIVERTSGSATPQESPLVHAMSTEQLHARANTLQQQIEHAETQQRERSVRAGHRRSGDPGLWVRIKEQWADRRVMTANTRVRGLRCVSRSSSIRRP